MLKYNTIVVIKLLIKLPICQKRGNIFTAKLNFLSFTINSEEFPTFYMIILITNYC